MSPRGWETSEERRERLFREELGDAALNRVREKFADRYACCWERTEDGHHVACPNRPADDDSPPVIPGQESLA